MSIWHLIKPSPEEKKVIEALKKSESKSMDVVGRGTLIKDVNEVINSQQYKDLLEKSNKILSK